MDICHFCGLHNLVHGDRPLVVAVHDVFRDGTVKQNRLLRNNAQLASNKWNIESFNIMAIQGLKRIKLRPYRFLTQNMKVENTH